MLDVICSIEAAVSCVAEAFFSAVDDISSIEPVTFFMPRESSLVAAEIRRAMSDAIGRLPFNYRAAVVLRHVMGLDYAEAARALDLPLNTFKSHLLRGTKLLRESLAAELDAPRSATAGSNGRRCSRFRRTNAASASASPTAGTRSTRRGVVSTGSVSMPSLSLANRRANVGQGARRLLQPQVRTESHPKSPRAPTMDWRPQRNSP